MKNRDGELVGRARAITERDNREGVQRGARDGGRRVLYLIFATHETHFAPHVSRSAPEERCAADRCFFGESPFEESISVPRARARVCPLLKLV